jgi:1-phosphofructokinase/tagatose 6-phosphate kinase
MIRELRKSDVMTLIDTDGEPLRHAARAEPDVISPNVLEAEELVGHEFNDDEDRIIAVGEMVEQGAREAIMTLEDGCVACMVVDGHPQRFRVSVPTREDVAGVGAGDAFLAGYVAARYSGKPPPDCLAYGVACGAESTNHLGAGLVEPREVERLLSDVDVRAVSAPAEVT